MAKLIGGAPSPVEMQANWPIYQMHMRARADQKTVDIERRAKAEGKEPAEIDGWYPYEHLEQTFEEAMKDQDWESNQLEFMEWWVEFKSRFVSAYVSKTGLASHAYSEVEGRSRREEQKMKEDWLLRQQARDVI